ncbi:MAG: VWA domain-containing protein [Acidimicrobiales bacterium]
MQRMRRRSVVRFTTVDMLASVAPRRPGWQRHVSAGVLLACVTALVIGFAQPARVTRSPRQRATVMLALDVSGSMIADDVVPSRLAAATRAARSFAAALPSGVQLGLVSFSTSAAVVVPPTTDRAMVIAAIDGLHAGGGTATGDAIDLSVSAIKALPPVANGKPAPAVVVLMSDGTPTIGHGDQSPTQAVTNADHEAKLAGVPVSTIAFGTQSGVVTIGGRTLAVPSDPAAMAQIATETGGRTFSATTSGRLKSVYTEIGRAVGYDVHRHEITAWFTGAGLLLAMLSAVAALVWNQRLV